MLHWIDPQLHDNWKWDKNGPKGSNKVYCIMGQAMKYNFEFHSTFSRCNALEQVLYFLEPVLPYLENGAIATSQGSCKY